MLFNLIENLWKSCDLIAAFFAKSSFFKGFQNISHNIIFLAQKSFNVKISLLFKPLNKMYN